MVSDLTPDEIIARLLYRDGLMLVIDKPAGIHVHRGPKGGESLEDSFDALRFGLPRRPALAHRPGVQPAFAASVPFPTFASSRSTHFYERRKQRDTSKS